MSSIVLTHPSSATSRLRLTRRGRAVLTGLVAVPLIAATVFAGLNGGGAMASRDAATTVFATVTIQPGESLWDVAQDAAPASDPRDVVRRIMDLNQLESAVVQPGQRLAMPAF